MDLPLRMANSDGEWKFDPVRSSPLSTGTEISRSGGTPSWNHLAEGESRLTREDVIIFEHAIGHANHDRQLKGEKGVEGNVKLSCWRVPSWVSERFALLRPRVLAARAHTIPSSGTVMLYHSFTSARSSPSLVFWFPSKLQLHSAFPPLVLRQPPHALSKTLVYSCSHWSRHLQVQCC